MRKASRHIRRKTAPNTARIARSSQFRFGARLLGCAFLFVFFCVTLLFFRVSPVCSTERMFAAQVYPHAADLWRKSGLSGHFARFHHPPCAGPIPRLNTRLPRIAAVFLCGREQVYALSWAAPFGGASLKERKMKIRNSLRSLKGRHRDCRVVRRKGRVYVINKTQRRFKARQG